MISIPNKKSYGLIGLGLLSRIVTSYSSQVKSDPHRCIKSRSFLARKFIQLKDEEYQGVDERK
jgi:hypothetical protein